MEITLKNGETIELDWNPIVLEYLEEYDGGIEQLKKDVEDKNCRFRTFNFIIYCAISSVYPRELGYREAVSLVNINDLDKIIAFITKHVNDMQMSAIEVQDEKIVDNIEQGYFQHKTRKHIR